MISVIELVILNHFGKKLVLPVGIDVVEGH